MIAFLIICILIVNGINKALCKLEYKQAVLAYDIYVLNKQIKEEEQYLLHSHF